MSSAEQIDPRREKVPCRDGCGTEVEITVLYRRRSDDDEWVRGPTPPVVCALCDRRDAFEALAPQSRPLTVEDWLALHGVNTRKHGHATLDNFDAKDAPLAPGAARAFVEDTVAAGRHDRVRGLYLVSHETGTGKSHLAVAIMRAVYEARPSIRVVFLPADRLITKVQDSYGTGTTDALIERLARAELFVLDDLGREKSTADALRVLCTVLDEREGAPTVITSNELPHQLGQRHEDDGLWARVASRLGDEVYRYVAVDGRDRRFAA